MTAPVDPAGAAGERATRALVSLAWVTTQLAASRNADTGIERILANIRKTLVADEVAVWTYGPDGLRRSWGDGITRTPEGEVQAGLVVAEAGGDAAGQGSSEAARVTVIPILRGDRRVGALVVRLARALDTEERLLTSALTSLLALELTHAERSRQLEVEVASRTDEIERGRRFTEKVLDSLPLGLYVVDREYRIQGWNGRPETGMEGILRADAIGRTVFEVLTHEPAGELRREFEQVFATGRILEYRREREFHGERRTYRVFRFPMRLGDGPVTHVITIGEDVTDWAEAQQRYAQAEKLAAIGQLVAGVMHEINNPLATIAACAESLGYRLEDLRDGGAPVAAETIEYLDIIDNEIQRSKRIVDGLLDFSRPKQAHRERVNVNEVVEQTLFLLQHHVRFRRLTVRTLLDPMVGRVPQANQERLVQVLMALLINAADAMTNRGTVEISTSPVQTPAPGVAITITDEGKGIPRSELDRIFEPFYTTKPPGEGTGLGLSICYAIVQEHGGQLTVESVEGRGSTFTVTLPVVEA
ncbi:MAG: hypothetical protein RL139_1178 [Gemmatimonadota bacterium]